jgi:hypothetical protein
MNDNSPLPDVRGHPSLYCARLSGLLLRFRDCALWLLVVQREEGEPLLIHVE